MSTRCQIRVIKNGYPLNYYHHFDGYLSGVGRELRDWLLEIGVESGKRSEDVDMLVAKMSADNQYEPTFGRHTDINFFYLLDFDNGIFKAYELYGCDPWADEDSDDYDKSKAWYEQLPCKISREVDLLGNDFDNEQDFQCA